MTGPEPVSSPCQAPPGYWDEEEGQAQNADQKNDKPRNEESPDTSNDQRADSR
ncbi:MAG TPA: hypothetical protein VKD71_04720 [Gemmataceae bacterium]|nr:hypothetical protein [Gemmataceae bacterium]